MERWYCCTIVDQEVAQVHKAEVRRALKRMRRMFAEITTEGKN